MTVRVIEWDEIAPLISYFQLWSGTPERSWFTKAWRGLSVAGLTSYSNDEERHWVLIRGMALGIMYRGYCHLEWDECCALEDCVSEICSGDELNLSRTRIGNMQESSSSVDVSDDQELFCAAVLDLTSQVKRAVYDALSNEFGGAAMLYAGLYVSREEGNNQEDLASVVDEIFDSSHTPVGRDEAFGFVCSGMQAVDG